MDLFSHHAIPLDQPEAEEHPPAPTATPKASPVTAEEPPRRTSRRGRARQAALDLASSLPADQAPERLRERFTTAADVLAGIDGIEALTPNQRKEVVSAIHTLSRVAKLPPQEIGLAPSIMVPILRPILPASVKLSMRRWTNVKYALRLIAKRCGHHVPDHVKRRPVAPAIEAMVTRLQPESKSAALRGFVRYLEDTGVPMEAAAEEHLAGYRDWLLGATYEIRVDTTIVAVRSAWNLALKQMPDWPGRRLELPPRARQVRVDLACFPPALLAEIDAYRACRITDDLDGPAARPVSRATAEDRRKRLFYMASVLVHTGVKPEELTGLAALVTPDNLKTVLRWMRARSTVKTFTMNEVHVAITAMDVARTMLRLSDERMQPFKDIRKRVDPGRVGLSDRARTRLRPLDAADARARVFKAPYREFEMAEALLTGKRGREDGAGQGKPLQLAPVPGKRPVRAAQHHERGLALRLLLEVPLRRRTLAVIHLDEHLRYDDRGRPTHLYMPGDVTKNGVAVDCPLSDELSHIIKRHLKVYRPLLRDSVDNRYLFPGHDGRSRCPDSIAARVTDVVRQHAGLTFNVSLVRHLVATMLYEEDPNAGPVVQRLLLHTQLKTSERMYGSRSSRSAHGVWSRMLEGRLPKGTKPPAKAARRGKGRG